MALFDTLREEVFTEIKASLNLDSKESRENLILEYPPEPNLGDFAFPAFKLAKMLRKAPPVIAKELSEKLSQNPELTEKFLIKNVGPYVNFHITRDFLVKKTLKDLLFSKQTLGEKKLNKPQTIVLEFSSPNVAKAFNIYHLRGTMIGNCLYRIFKARGYNTIAINHLGDWGTQFGTLTLAYQLWGDEKRLDNEGIPYLVELYVRINKEIETDQSLSKKAQENFSKLEKGDEELKSLWLKFVKLSLREFDLTYQRLGVHFDHILGESFYIDQIKSLRESLESKNLLQLSDGAFIVDLSAYEMPPCIVIKQDGSSIYATRDLAAAIYRKKIFNFDKMIYIVGGEQKLHFAQLFKVLDLMGNAWAKDCTHVDYGLYRFGDKDQGFQKMSTRKGKFVTMESVLDQAVEHVEAIMKEKGNFDAKAAEAIGVSAIIFNDLSTDRNHDVNFSLEKALDFDGETGPYIQYAHTRCLSILRNAPKELSIEINTSKLLDLNSEQPGIKNLYDAAILHLNEPEELQLIRTLGKLPLILDLVLENYRPSVLANFLIDITKSFNVFYRSHKVLVDDQELARARLSLVLATQRTLLKAMQLLSMQAPEKM